MKRYAWGLRGFVASQLPLVNGVRGGITLRAVLQFVALFHLIGLRKKILRIAVTISRNSPVKLPVCSSPSLQYLASTSTMLPLFELLYKLRLQVQLTRRS